eukprot:3031188-Alexandrium_andersonii.AAC.1
MSASLVGSEMCIRDRRGKLEPAPDNSCQEVCPGRLRANGFQAPRRPWIPVSYTHLTLPTICSV